MDDLSVVVNMILLEAVSTNGMPSWQIVSTEHGNSHSVTAFGAVTLFWCQTSLPLPASCILYWMIYVPVRISYVSTSVNKKRKNTWLRNSKSPSGVSYRV